MFRKRRCLTRKQAGKFLTRFLLYSAAMALIASYGAVFLPAQKIPKAAWRRPIGLPLENPGVRRNASDIDDGYWQGAPVGGFGSGTFSRTYRGDFARWHMKAGVHNYGVSYANQFAMFQNPKETPRVPHGSCLPTIRTMASFKLGLGLSGRCGRIRRALS